MGIATDILETNGVAVEHLRPVDYEIPAGLKHDYAGLDGYERDGWPQIEAKIDACDILIIGTSVWLGEKSSLCNRVLERMYGYTHDLNDKGQYRDYGIAEFRALDDPDRSAETPKENHGTTK